MKAAFLSPSSLRVLSCALIGVAAALVPAEAEIDYIGNIALPDNHDNFIRFSTSAAYEVPDSNGLTVFMTLGSIYYLPLFELFHGIDSLDLAKDMDRIAAEEGTFPRVLLEINVAGEATKYGFRPETIEREIDSLLALPRVQVEGLMTIAPYADDPEASRPHFRALRELRDRLEKQAGVPLPRLSMGMSGDFEVAVEEGATLVRVGSAIFGSRPKLAENG